MQAPIGSPEGGQQSDLVDRLVRMSNALSRDDVGALEANLVHDCLLPGVHVLSQWTAPIAHVFAAGHGGVVGRASANSIVVRTPHSNGAIAYDPKDDVGGTLFPLGLPLARHALGESPLTRAVACGSRQCLGVLLRNGARADPSTEALLAVALDRLFWNTVVVVEYHGSDSLSCKLAWGARVDRPIDPVGVLGDLLAALPRSPSLHPLDINPLSVLRAVVSRGGHAAYGAPPADLCERVARAVDMLLRAGYSPDEPVAHLPQKASLYGRLPCGQVADSTVDGFANPCDYTPSDSNRPSPTYAELVAMTERQAAAAAYALGKARICGWAHKDDIVGEGAQIIQRAYDASQTLSCL
ncbi:hypothetical protein pqer_cds_606 [Pandoravirus quercus]|uniref:Uncharacterized protein n=2 Tax=Pandoravirus TaxID=2060084 RepID=A0A2U7U9A7_9VIRU|nr:hypothetical protein pqer_cds_606 [Pandoravirus quercus]AVK75028.1 hypothetical protein pqer_cds_606 [Pandoravirus quercus]QBZ81216.1 hypothetical protein pclt_cds_623 [Pandoravirus celtis]